MDRGFVLGFKRIEKIPIGYALSMGLKTSRSLLVSDTKSAMHGRDV